MKKSNSHSPFFHSSILFFFPSFLLFSFLSPPLSFSQQNDEFKTNFEKATLHLIDENYPEALKIFSKLSMEDATNANLNFLIGLCYLKSPLLRDKAIKYFEKALKACTPDYLEGEYQQTLAPLYTYKYMGEAYHLNNQFEKAIETYLVYKTKIKDNQLETIREVDRQIQMCRNAVQMTKNPINVSILNIGLKINSAYPEYAPLISADESVLIFTSRRKECTGGQIAADGKFYEDVFISENINGQWSDPQSIGKKINTDDHESASFLSVDGQLLFLYKFKNKSGDIYMSHLNGKEWSEPEKLSSAINSSGIEPHACLSADGNVLFFASNRPGGFGGRDIYSSKKLPNGEWALPVNAGSSMNTIYDEDFPYMHPDGKTLYFSSNSELSMGGYDIFWTEQTETGSFKLPQNMGYPLNTSGDDFFFTPTSDGTRAYISSFRENGFGEHDIYLVSLPDEKEKELTVYKGIFKDIYGNVPDEALITVYNNETSELVGKYKPNAVTGKYILILAEDGNYNITYSAKDRLFTSENLTVPEHSSYQMVHSHQELKPITAGAVTVLKNVFFDENKSTIKTESTVELKEILKLLKEKNDLLAEISGHTDSKGDNEPNVTLSQQRAQAVVNYLVSSGIDSQRLTAIGYGETRPIAPNVKPDGTDDETGRAKNRRVELKITKAEK